METFKIEIQEILSKLIEVEAVNIDGAISMVKKMYQKEEIVLDDSNFIEVDIRPFDEIQTSDEKTILMKEIINYLYADEKKHFEEFGKDTPKDHIYLKLKKMKTLLG